MSVDWDEAHRKHFRFIWGLLWNRCRNRELAEDLAQETFVKAIRYEHRFTDDGRGLRPWLNTIAINIFRDHLRPAITRMTEPVPNDLLFGNDVDDRHALSQTYRGIDVVQSAEDDVIDTEDASVILHAMTKSLSERQLEMVLLRYWGDQTHAEIGERFGVNARAVNVALYRARKNVERHLVASGSH